MQCDPFTALARAPSDLLEPRPSLVPRDAQDLMAHPFFALSKSPRLEPIAYCSKRVTIHVEADARHGMATIWDADILIWAASRLVAVRKAGLPSSPLLVTTPFEILTFIGRGTSARDYRRLKAALDRLQATIVSTTIRQPAGGPGHCFSWLTSWHERVDRCGRSDGIALRVPDWFYEAVLTETRILSIDRAYFHLSGGLERWLYRLARKHAGRQAKGWRFDLRHLHRKSASLTPYKRFAFELRDIVRRQPLPGYRLEIGADAGGSPLLAFEPVAACGRLVDSLVLSGTPPIVRSGTRVSCQQEPKGSLGRCFEGGNRALNLDSNRDSNFSWAEQAVERDLSSERSMASGAGRKGRLAPIPDIPDRSDGEPRCFRRRPG